LEQLNEHTVHDASQREEVARNYEERLARRRSRLRRVADEFPDFYERFVTRLFTKVALTAAQQAAAKSHGAGEIGAKAYVRIERSVKQALAELPLISSPAPKLRPGDLIGAVPLLNGLSSRLLDQLAQQAQAVTFLGNDIVIGEGEKGDALYIITHGVVEVSKGTQVVAELRDGDFIGEMALLGEHIRTATVKAKTPTTMLRLRRRDVLSLAETAPELKIRLEAAGYRRRESAAH
jgi:hypothetical protein